MPQTLVQVVLPAMGESVADGSVTSWRKKPGDFVQAGEALVDVTTDKVDVEVPATASGRLARILASEGATVAVGAPLAEIDTSAQPGAATPTASASKSQPAEPQLVVPTGNGAAGQPVTVTMPSMGESVSEGTVVEWRRREGEQVQAGDALVEITTDKVNAEVPAPQAGVLRRILVQPNDTVKVGQALAELAPIAVEGAERSAAIADAAGNTPSTTQPAILADEQGEVAFPAPRSYAEPAPLQVRRSAAATAADGTAAATPPIAKMPAQPLPPDATATPLRGPAGTLVKYMEQSLTIPTATSFRTIEVDVLDERRKALIGALKAAGRGEKVSFTHLIAFALVHAVATVPTITASFRREGDVAQRVARGVHLGIAVDVRRADGSRMLVVPVVRDADRLSFADFHRAYETLVDKARAGTLSPDELSGATFTLTNPGGLGTSASVPRLMPGQGAIIAAGAIGYPPGLRSQAGASGIAKVMTLTSTYDHRIIQGAESGE